VKRIARSGIRAPAARRLGVKSLHRARGLSRGSRGDGPTHYQCDVAVWVGARAIRKEVVLGRRRRHPTVALQSLAGNPTEGSPITPCVVISSQVSAIPHSQHRSAIVHVHRSRRVCERLILILVDQRDALRVGDLNHGHATPRDGGGCAEEYGDLCPTLEDLQVQDTALRMVVKRGSEVTRPSAREVWRFYQPQFAHKGVPPETSIEKGIKRGVKSHAGGRIRPPGDREVDGNQKFRRDPS
jgi:hypothetical protein